MGVPLYIICLFSPVAILTVVCYCCSVTKSCPTLSDPMDCSVPGFPVLHYLSPGLSSNPCPLSRWCYRTISSSVTLFSSCLQSFPAAGSFPVRQVFASGCQRFGASALASVLPANIQGWFPLGWTSLILLSKGLSRILLQTFCQQSDDSGF